MPLQSIIAASRRRYTFDADALAYLAAVEAADTQALEPAVRVAINNFVKGCKSDGEWDAIQVLRCYAGPRTLAGISVPMKGVAPTFVGFELEDINRKTGLKGNGSNKYVNHNRNNNADGQNNQQIWSYLTEAQTNNGQTQVVFGVGVDANGSTHIGRTNTSTNWFIRNMNSNTSTGIAVGAGIGLVGMSRNNSANFDIRAGGVTQTNIQSSQVPLNANIFSFARNNNGAISHSNHRAAFDAVGQAWTSPLNIENRIIAYLSEIDSIIS